MHSALGFSAFAGACCLIWFYHHDRAPAAAAPPPPRAVIAPSPTPPEPKPPAPPAPPANDARMSEVAVGEIDLAWMPKSFVIATKRSPEMPDFDMQLERTSELAAFVDSWLAGTGQAPRIAYRRGVVFAESAEDRGDDGPYPRSAGVEGMRVCGTASTWLRNELRAEMEREAVECHQNVCAYGGMEYQPRSYVVFHWQGGEWYLDAWANVFYATLRPETAERNYRETAAAMKRVATTGCLGELAGAY
jgi:hypothetical protein